MKRMISKKHKKPKSKWRKGETKFLGGDRDCVRPKDRIVANIRIRREKKEEAEYQEEQRKERVNNPMLKLKPAPAQNCKHGGCRRSRRHGSAYCGNH